MNTPLMCSLQLTQLSDHAVNELAPSFKYLPHTSHADGEYRLRRYSIIRIHNGKIEPLPSTDFVQSNDINHFQGNVVRHFEALDDELIHCGGMLEMCKLFQRANTLPDDQPIEIHQMRIATLDSEVPASPEGIHQDGFEHIAVIGIDRHNIKGGEFLVYKDKTASPFLCTTLQHGEMAILADDILWHNAHPIKAIKKHQQGYWDVFVLTTKEIQHGV
ncbi:agglutination protein [Photobacterium kishitanii]|uniref:Agglutination protein n=1 Tax=Photobacterium kishitanii TaxID=318456 RepID=A0AAX0YS92_9GAMM|nr:2OG-Fe dioxygenase family protein [Photobacterium kishitanii]PSU85916.1 agglutination protein [Photobacterium kishitanii]PSV07002.1 agglutination protein [Photobacterium kishitanii]PSV14440.1 agglutination protein [Photobacterium kishitanii]PSV77978.1 agglutination protein [Photobacterium kishitanii]PSW47092.1 agglutination protein [Photobacterium kishitanii]